MRRQWVPLHHSQIKELCKAQKDYGRDSEYFRGVLQATLTEVDVTPYDIRRLFTCLLNPTERAMWEAAWKRGVTEALPSLWEQPHTGLDLMGNVLAIDQLLGTGNWADGHSQASAIPQEALRESARAAEKAFLALPGAAPLLSFSRIFQGAEESFLDFVERLRKAIEQQVADEVAREHILKEVASTNANSACRDAILSLPMHPSPSLHDMLEVCTRKVLIMPSREGEKRKQLPPRVSTAEEAPENTFSEATCRSPAPGPSAAKSPCHLCGKLGHWMPDCPLRREFYEFKKGQGLLGKTQTKN